jgi:hypothetical protein
LTTSAHHPRTPPLADDRRRSDPAADRQRELDTKVEALTQQIAEVVNSAGQESRQHLREYAIDLLREETERDDAPAGATDHTTHAPEFSPLAFAILLGLVSLPTLLLFPPLGIGLFGVALVMGIWGVLDALFRRR